MTETISFAPGWRRMYASALTVADVSDMAVGSVYRKSAMVLVVGDVNVTANPFVLFVN